MAQPHSLEALFLCVLLRGPNYGLGIATLLAGLDPELQPGQGALYPALRRLEDDGLATSKEVSGPPERGGRPRRFYVLTAKGRRRAHELTRFFGALAGKLEAA